MREIESKKIKLRNEFKRFCSENKKDKEGKKQLAQKIWNSYKDDKIKVYEWYHTKFTDMKMDYTNARNSSMVVRSKPGIDLKNYDLNLRNDVTPSILITSTIIYLLLTLLSIAFFAILHIVVLLIASIAMLTSMYAFVMHVDTTRFRYIEKNDPENNVTKSEMTMTINGFKSAYNMSRFKNGNIKWGVFEKNINEWYKQRVIAKINNPYKIQQKLINLDSNNFITSGGVYAWVFNSEVIYIGKANNFKRRMKEHYAGLSGVGEHSEHKYNVGLHPSQVKIMILAITNDEDEQSVLESYFFEKYKDNRLLNSTGTLSWKKIMQREKCRVAWDRIKSKI